MEPGTATRALTADIRLNLVRVSHSQGKHAEIAEHLRYVRALIADLGDPRREALERMYTCEYLRAARDCAGALDAGQAGLRIAGELSDPALVKEAHFHLGCVHLVRGDYPRALEHLEQATEGAEARPGRVTFPYFPGLARRARCLAELGRFEEARGFAQRGLEVADAGGHPSVEAPSGLGLVLLGQGEAAQAIPPLELTLERSRVQQFAILLGTTIAALAHAYALAGRGAEAIRLLDEFLEGRVVVPDHLSVSRIFTSLGHAALLVGRPDDTRRLAKTALDRAITSGEEGGEAKARALLGDIIARDLSPDVTRVAWTEAEQQLRSALSLAERLGMRPLIAHCHSGLGKLQRRGGDRSQAEKHLATAMYQDMGMCSWLEELTALLKESPDERSM